MRKVKPVHEAYMGKHPVKCYTKPERNTVRNLLHQSGEEGLPTFKDSKNGRNGFPIHTAALAKAIVAAPTPQWSSGQWIKESGSSRIGSEKQSR